MKRYRILAAAIVMQMCLGATYAWSVFVQPLKQSVGILQGTVQPNLRMAVFGQYPGGCVADRGRHGV